MKQKRLYLYIFFCCTLCAIVFCAWYLSKSKHDTNTLSVFFLDVGQGDAIFIQAPNGNQLLVDGGPGNAVLPVLSRVMPWGDTSIDTILATHADADHIGGLAQVIERYHVGHFIENGVGSKTRTYARLQETVDKNNLTHTIARRGMHFVLDPQKNIYFEVLAPGDELSSYKDTNDGSIVGRLVYGNTSFMLTGDGTLTTESAIMKSYPSEKIASTVLKLGHHGSHTSSGESWLRVVAPSVAVVSAGAHNRYGHPHQNVIERVRSFGIPILYTGTQGTIEMYTDGASVSY
jgi:competence protein ComEC